MLTIMVLMAIASTGIEMMIVMRSDSLMRWFEKYQTIGLVFSVVISFILGTLFGMAGMIVGGAAVISTVLSAAIYNLNLIPLARALPGNYRAAKASVLKTWHEFQAIIHVMWMIVTAPVRLVMAIMRFFNRIASMLPGQHKLA